MAGFRYGGASILNFARLSTKKKKTIGRVEAERNFSREPHVSEFFSSQRAKQRGQYPSYNHVGSQKEEGSCCSR
jgi:hypothetical protein